jgi:hypothetical protein
MSRLKPRPTKRYNGNRMLELLKHWKVVSNRTHRMNPHKTQHLAKPTQKTKNSAKKITRQEKGTGGMLREDGPIGGADRQATLQSGDWRSRRYLAARPQWAQAGVPVLLVAQGDDGIDAHGFACGHVAGQQGDGAHHYRDEAEGGYVAGADAVD